MMASTPLGWKGIGAIVFVSVGDQPSLFESVLSPELLRLPEELGRVDAPLGDPVFFEPFVPFSIADRGLPPDTSWQQETHCTRRDSSRPQVHRIRGRPRDPA